MIKEGIEKVSAVQIEAESTDLSQKVLNLKDILSLKYSLFGYLGKFVVHFTLSFSMPLCSNYYYKVGYEPWFFGIVLSLASIVYIYGASLTKKLLEKKSRREVIYMGSFI